MHKIRERSWVEIDLAAYRHNLQALKALMHPKQEFLQIVKADAYGHGAFEIARIAVLEGAVMLGVANADEGKLLRVQGCKIPILILSPSLETELDAILAYDLIPSVSDAAFLFSLNNAAVKAEMRVRIHLKFDTGMHRSGAHCEDWEKLINALDKCANLTLEGIFSHFASSESDKEYSAFQEMCFDELIGKLKHKPRYIHISNSSAIVNGMGQNSNLVRLGILCFGVYTHPAQIPIIDLKPVMTFKAAISQIKSISAGAGLGYNLTWTAARDTRYAIIPIGYADGYDFLLSNRGIVLVNDSLCPVIGRISMDMITIDITDVEDVRIGDEATLLGVGHPALKAEMLAAQYNGSAYELLCQVGRRAKRYYFDENGLVTSSPLSRRDFVSSDFSDSKLAQIIESALAQRLQSEEIGELISREILRNFFYNKDMDIHYRKNFKHKVRFDTSDRVGYYRAHTELSFRKILQNDYFIVACANSDEALKAYFRRNDVEYRWLMDDNFTLSAEVFELSEVRVNDLVLDTELINNGDCFEIRCFHPSLKSLVGREMEFFINTRTLYPTASHQLSIFITELTHGVSIIYEYPETIKSVETIPFFSGQNKFPMITKQGNSISVETSAEEWVFPLSGVVFAY
ncbi:MAG: alanine racemase [Candidatus Cloacimonadaceae bacterium]|nr:alanine racemase [Candidatus Cloacimonadaceae bacterium]